MKVVAIFIVGAAVLTAFGGHAAHTGDLLHTLQGLLSLVLYGWACAYLARTW